MKTIKGPGIFLAQFIGAQAPFNTLEGVAQWAADLGYKALQIPCNHPAIFDVERAAASQTGGTGAGDQRAFNTPRRATGGRASGL